MADEFSDWRDFQEFFRNFSLSPCHPGLSSISGDVAAVVRSSKISPLNNRTNKRNKERRRRKNNRAATYSGPMKTQAFERCYTAVDITTQQQNLPSSSRVRIIRNSSVQVFLLQIPSFHGTTHLKNSASVTACYPACSRQQLLGKIGWRCCTVLSYADFSKFIYIYISKPALKQSKEKWKRSR